MLDLESPRDRLGLFYDGADKAMVLAIADDVGPDGSQAVTVQVTVPCRFSRSYFQFAEMEGYHPTALFMDEHMVGIEQGHRIMIAGHVWRIDERMPDGTGLTNCLLKYLGRRRRIDPREQYAYWYDEFHYGLAPQAPDSDPENPRLAYPYTVAGHFDWGTADTYLETF